ncbi:MAG TPA: metal ABC transporter permease [Xanthobacteraceae bacterium]|nr:metal ABC transporter permease [Xanthobacteraceae bacterium]
MSAVGEALSFLVYPFAASVAFVLIHAYLGVHVLRRNIVFADLALAQLSALGATVAFALGYAPVSPAGFAYAFAFTTLGAALLTATRALSRFVSQEAFVGILYVAATATTVLVVDRSPQGAEHVKKILIGSILTVEPSELIKFAALYGAIGLLHWFARRPMLAVATEAAPAGRSRFAVSLWDFLFFLSFGVVVTSSVATAGVLLVFSFLIVPAVIGSLFSRAVSVVLAIAWSVGILASALGLASSFVLDLPTGAAMVVAFVLMLALAGAAKALVFVPSAQRRRHWRIAANAAAVLALATVLASSLWLIVNPAADQPLFAVIERATGLGPASFLGTGERTVYQEAIREAARFQTEVAALNAKERAARVGAPMSDEEVRRVASYQQSYNEMARGELFVEDVLRAKARGRERWIVGLPAAALALAGLGLLTWSWPRRVP